MRFYGKRDKRADLMFIGNVRLFCSEMNDYGLRANTASAAGGSEGIRDRCKVFSILSYPISQRWFWGSHRQMHNDRAHRIWAIYPLLQSFA